MRDLWQEMRQRWRIGVVALLVFAVTLLAFGPLVDWMSSVLGFWLTAFAVALLMAALTVVMLAQVARLGERTAVLRQLNETLNRSERRWRTVIQASADAIIGLDGERHIVVFNQAAERLFGYDEAEMLDTDVTRLLAHDADGGGGLGVLFATPPIHQAINRMHEAYGQHRDGTIFPLEVALSVGEWDGRRIVVLSMRDITERKAAAEALWRSEARYRSLTEDVLDSSAVGIFILDADFRVVWMNEAMERYFGVTRDAVIGQYKADVIRARIKPIMADGADFEQRVLATYADNTTLEQFECYVLPGEGREGRWLEHRSQPIRSGLYAGGRIEHYYDITARKEVVESLHGYQRDLQAKTESLVALNAIADLLYRTLNIETVVQQALTFVLEYAQAQAGVLFLVDAASSTLRALASLGRQGFEFATYDLERGVVDPAVIVSLSDDRSLSSLSAQHKRVMVSADLARDERLTSALRDDLMARGFRKLLTVPVMFHAQPVGVLEFSYQDGPLPDQQQQDVLLAIGRTIGLALANAEYVARIEAEVSAREQAQAAEREQRLLAEAMRDNAAAIGSTLNLDQVLDHMLEGVSRVLATPHIAGIMLIEANALQVVKWRATDLPDIPQLVQLLRRPLAELADLRWVMTHRRPLLQDDVRENPDWIVFEGLEWVRSQVSLPIIVERDVIGFLCLYSEAVGVFTTAHLEWLQPFIDQAGVAIQNARLFAAERRQREITGALYEIGLLLNSTRSLDEILEELLVFVQLVETCDAANVILLEGDQARVMRTFGYDAPERRNPHMVSFSLAETPNLLHVVETQQVFTIPDIAAYPDWVDVPGTEWIRSWVGVPITARDGSLIGILSLDSAQPSAYDESLQEVLLAVANTAALAIENARLFATERRQHEVANTLREIGLVLTRALDQEVVLQRILEQVERVLPYEAASIWLAGEDGENRLTLGVGYERFGVAERVRELSFSHKTDPIGRRLYEQGSVLIIPDVRQDPEWHVYAGFAWVRSWAGSLITEQGKPIGKLVLEHTTPGFYGPEHEAILSMLTTHVSIAFENARLFQKTQQYLDQMITLRRISLELAASQQDFTIIMDVIIERFTELLQADSTAIWLWQPEREQLVQIAWRNTIPDYVQEGRALAWGEGLVGRSLAQQEVLWVDDYQSWPGMAAAFADAPFHAGLSVPMWWRGEPVGALAAALVDPARRFDEGEMRLLQLFAAHVAPTIVNARLYDEVQRFASSLQDLVHERTEELDRERVQLQAILDAMGEGVVYTEGQQIHYVNRALEQLGRAEQPALETLTQLAPRLPRYQFEPDAFAAYLDDVRVELEEHGIWRDEIRYRRPDGVVIDLSFTTTRVSELGAELMRAVTLVRDVSRERALEAQKDRFIAHASHELRTPLTNINTRLYLARRQPDRLHEHLGVIQNVTGRMLDLVRDLLDVSRFDRGVIPMQPQAVGVQDLVQNVVTVQRAEAERRMVALRAETPAQPLQVWADPDRMTQVVTNLVMNAISYTQAGGQVTVRAVLEPTGTRQLVTIAVQDSGIGIAPDVLPHIFEPFFRATEGNVTGTGLGLTISQDIVKAHGSQIVVESVPGEGSLFSFSLELVD